MTGVLQRPKEHWPDGAMAANGERMHRPARKARSDIFCLPHLIVHLTLAWAFQISNAFFLSCPHCQEASGVLSRVAILLGVQDVHVMARRCNGKQKAYSSSVMSFRYFSSV
ncbi:hypothetical protein U9M48_031833 [Paspalum notatum var. saurae]|uniref:Uncharacterized protein n=1 Tax=Paspalum notatum var. saurae TaxID=547442 RepID=A0AAQ3U3W7_PASNO